MASGLLNLWVTANDFIVCQLSHWKNRKTFEQLRTQSGDYSLKGFDEKECIYIHIPKAAGISVNKALFGNFGGGHMNVKAYKRIFGPVTYRRYFSFTFVRNPYVRLFSAWNFLRKGGFHENDRAWAAEFISGYSTFDQFIDGWLNEESIWTKEHFKPQYSFVCDVHDVPEVDFIGKVENMDEDFETVCEILEVENKLRQFNSCERDNADWSSFYSAASKKKVSQIYKRDFELFNYSTGYQEFES